MKISFVLLLIVVVASASIRNDELNQNARILLEKIKFLVAKVEDIRGDLQKAPVKAKEGGDKIELGISNDAKIKEIEQKLDSYATNKNADECKNLYTLKRKDLKQKLQSILEDEVVEQAKSITQSAEFVEKELSTISAKLQGAKLEDYGIYAARIHMNDDVISNFDHHSRLIVDFILKTKIDVQLQNQIDTNVYIPVNDCLNNL